MKMTTNLSAKGLLVLFSLLASSLIVPPEFNECQNLFPDEYMDLSAICKVFKKQSSFSHVATLTAPLSAVKYSWSYYLVLEAFSPQSTHAKNAFATLMRC